MRFGLFRSAIIIAIGAVCATGSANAADMLVAGSCVTITGGCLFTGTINDNYFSTDLVNHPNSYANAVDAYNAYAAANPSVGGLLNVTAIGESAGDPAAWTPPYPDSDDILDPNGNVIGEVDFDQSNTISLQLRSGTWTVNNGQDVAYIAIDGGNQFDLYELTAPDTSGTWNTFDIDTGNAGLTHPQLFDMVLFADANTGVPEPATWAMLLMGFGMVGASLRTMRRKDAVATA